MKKYWLILAIVAIGVFLAVMISYISNPTPRKPKLTIEEKIAAVDADLKTLELTLGDYFSTHNTFPGDLISLSTPIAFISTLPVDPFNQDRHPVDKGENPYKYLKRGEGETAEVTLYSYGPDTDDDNASVVYDSQNGTISNGDIFRHISAPADDALMGVPGRWYEYENRQIAQASDDNGIKQFMLELKKARYDLNDPKDSAAVEATKSVRQDGWQGELTDLGALIERNQQAFSLIHEGAKRPFAKAVIQEKELHFGTANPNFISMQVLTKLTISQGKKFEAEGKPENAIRNYIDIAKFGQSIGNGTLIGKLIDIAIESMAYKAVQKALLVCQLDSTYLEGLLEELEKLEQSSPPLAIAFWHEHLGFVHSIEQVDTLGKPNTLGKILLRYTVFPFMKNKMIKNNTKFWTEAIDYAKKPYPEAITFDTDSRLEKMDPCTKMSIPNISKALIRDTYKKARSRGAHIMAALELFKRRNNAYPGTIDDLGTILEPIPLDPFTEKNFRYEKVGDAYRLYSLGPDMRDDFDALKYGPKNGTQSAADIIFRE